MSPTADRSQQFDPGENVPRPDPTLLTTQQLQREIFGLRELLEVKLGSSAEAATLNKQIVEARLDGMDKAILLLQHASDDLPARTDEKIAALREQNDEKFASIQTQFRERDVRTEQAAGAVKIAVDAALQAQKEAVGEQNKSSALAIAKSEGATTKQIDQLGVLLQQMQKAFDDKIADLKDRLTRIEGGKVGGEEHRAHAGSMAGWIFGGAVALVAIITLLLKLG